MTAARGTHLRAAALAAIAAALALAPLAAASKETTVGAGAILRMSGSDIYCTVVKSGKITVACFHLPGGASSSKRKGWAIFGSDAYAGVTPPGTNRPKKLLLEPSFASVPKVNGHPAGSQLILLKVGDLVPVEGTHMGIYVTKAKAGGNAIGVVYLGKNDGPIPGEITAGISNRYVTLVKVTGPSTTSVIYRHAVY
jgi:hypothetical protein